MIICRIDFGISKQPVGKLFALSLTFSLKNGQSVTACGVSVQYGKIVTNLQTQR